MVFPRKILINKNTQVFYVDFRLEINIFIFLIIKHAKFWLVSKSLLVRTKNYKITKLDFLMLRFRLFEKLLLIFLLQIYR